MKQIVLYTCPSCYKKYQLSSNVEVVNKFAWQKHSLERQKTCKACTPKE